MPSMTNFERGDIVLLPFPFSDQSSSKIRPAIIAHSKYPSDDLLVVGITSVGDSLRPGEFLLRSWKNAGLLHVSYVKRTVATVSFNLIRRRLGRVDNDDLAEFDAAIRLWFGIT
jgi:mRNA interferase MazF